MKSFQGNVANVKGRFAIVLTQYYPELCNGLLDGAIQVLNENGYSEDDYDVIKVPGSFEIAYFCDWLAKSGQYTAIVCLGILIKGQTRHFELIADQVALGIYQAAKEYNVPVSLGVLALTKKEDAAKRCDSNSSDNRGREAMQSALEMASLYNQLKLDKKL